MKKLLSILLAITIIIAAIPLASALEYDFWDADGNQNRFYYEDNGDGTCKITEFYGFKATEVFIPLQINGLTVTSIEEEAFANKTSLTLISIPAGVLSIGKKAFSGCINLSSVIIGNGVRVIFDQAFENCTALTGIHLRNVEAIGQMCFYNCTALTSINSNNLLTFIGARAFWKCEALNFARFSNTLETISDYAFKDCKGLTTLTFPASLTRIGIGAFQGCTALETINFGTGAIVIDGYAFENCLALTEVTIPQTVVSIGTNAFQFRNEEEPQSTATHPVKIICNWGSAGVAYGVGSGAPIYIIELNREVVFGDVDGNGQITIDDTIKMLRIASAIEPPIAESEVFFNDINGNGVIDLDDARILLRRTSGIA